MRCRSFARRAAGWGLGLLFALLIGAPRGLRGAELADELKEVPYRIAYETWRDDNWELFVTRADGGQQENLTKTRDVNELYPHVSPDGSKICFVCDEGAGAAKVRNVYWMDLAGGRRRMVARNSRQPCWRRDSAAIAYLGGEFDRFSYTDYATKGVFIYDLASASVRPHPNPKLHHLYNLCWSPDGRWFFATVHAGMGYRHAILAIEANGMGVYDLGIHGCRPDISPDGKRIAWGPSDWVLRVADLDFSGSAPKIVDPHDVVVSKKPMKVYHIDWSPDGKYVAFSRGPDTKILGLIPEVVGAKARGWDICVADPSSTNRWVQITHDGACNKEPDWIPLEKKP